MIRLSPAIRICRTGPPETQDASAFAHIQACRAWARHEALLSWLPPASLYLCHGCGSRVDRATVTDPIAELCAPNNGRLLTDGRL